MGRGGGDKGEVGGWREEKLDESKEVGLREG